MVEVAWLGPLLSIALLLLVIFLVFKLGKGIVWLIVNSFIGIILLWLVNLLPGVNIPFTLWNIAITAIGGLFGLVVLIILNILGIVL